MGYMAAGRPGKVFTMIAGREIVLVAAVLAISVCSAAAQNCKRVDTEVTCDDGRVGKFAGDAIIWPDGTRSSASPHPSVIIGNRPSVHVGPGVFVGQPNGGVAPLDDPNGRFKQQCAQLDGVSYCY
jgi:hypothetical protein